MRILDLFCGAGGAAVGYHRAGFEVVGVDIKPQPNYPFEFIQVDAIDYLDGLVGYGEPLFDAIHASPPCQHFTKYGNTVKDIKTRYEDLVGPTRELLEKTGLPYVIENVERAPLVNPVRLCGSMFDGMGTHDIQRHRLFECNFLLKAPYRCDHSIWLPDRYPGGRSKSRGGHSQALVRKTIEIGSWDIPLETQKRAMGMNWKIALRELSEAIPPAYTEYIGTQLLDYLREEMAA
jgi:DNA (cytosine-5)-methyltransferase 1